MRCPALHCSALLFGVLLLGMAAAPGCTVTDPPLVPCPDGADAVVPAGPASQADPCVSGRVVRSWLLSREVGRPELLEGGFELAEGGHVCVVITSPADAGGVAAPALSVELNGTPVAEERDFSHHPTRVMARVEVQPGSQALSARMRGTPHGSARIEIRYAPAYGPRALAQARGLADLEHSACLELNEILEARGPSDARRVLDGYVALGLVPGRLATDVNVHGVPSLLAPLGSLDLGSATAPEERAVLWIEANRGVLRFDDPDVELTPLPPLALPGGAFRVDLQERWRDLEVHGARLSVLLDPTGVVRGISGNFVPEIDAVLPPALDGVAAATLAERETGGAAIAAPVLQVLDLGVLRGERSAPLAWAVDTAAGGVWVDATTGEILAHASDPPGFGGITLVDDEPDTDPRTGRAVDYTVRLDSTGRFTPTGRCTSSQDPRCPSLSTFVFEAHDFFADAMGRTGGWSGPGNGLSGPDAIEADAPYTVLYGADPGHPFSTFRRRPVARLTSELTLLDGAGLVNESSVLGPAIELAERALSRDIVIHEFGHGALEVDLRTSAAPRMDACQVGAHFEHVADVYAMLGDASYGESIDDVLCVTGGTASSTACVRRHGTGPPAPGDECAGRSHFTDLDDALYQCNAHAQSCIPSRVFGLGLEAAAASSPISYHGVSVPPRTLDTTKALFDTVTRAGIRLDTDPLAYGFAYQLASLGLLSGCGVVRPCPPNFAETLAQPLWALGYWSPEVVLGPGLDTEVGPAVVSVGSDALVFFVPPRDAPGLIAHEVALYRDGSVLDAADGTSVPMSSFGFVMPPTESDLAASATGSLVTLGLVDESGAVWLRSSTTGGVSWDPPVRTTFAAATGAGTLSIAPFGRPRQVIGAAEQPGGGILLFSSDPLVASSLLIPTSEAATSPVIFATSATTFEVWARASGVESGHLWRWQGTLAPGTMGDPRLRIELTPIEVLTLFGTALLERQLIGVPTRTEPLDVELFLTPGGQEGGGLVLTEFLGRLQIYLHRSPGLVSGTAETHQLLDDVVVPALHPFELRARFGRRPAALNTVDPLTGVPVHLLISVGSDARALPERLVFSTKRSD